MPKKLTLSAPWTTFYREMKALFGEDPEIKVLFDEDEATIRLYVDNVDKADALATLLPTSKSFGNVNVGIDVIPSNREGEINPHLNTFFRAFKGNPAYVDMIIISGVFTNPISYCIFKNCVVQFFNDDLGDPHGLKSTLYEDIARDIFDDSQGTNFCTDVPEEAKKFGKPLGEWP